MQKNLKIYQRGTNVIVHGDKGVVLSTIISGHNIYYNVAYYSDNNRVVAEFMDNEVTTIGNQEKKEIGFR